MTAPPQPTLPGQSLIRQKCQASPSCNRQETYCCLHIDVRLTAHASVQGWTSSASYKLSAAQARRLQPSDTSKRTEASQSQQQTLGRAIRCWTPTARGFCCTRTRTRCCMGCGSQPRLQSLAQRYAPHRKSSQYQPAPPSACNVKESWHQVILGGALALPTPSPGMAATVAACHAEDRIVRATFYRFQEHMIPEVPVPTPAVACRSVW